MEKIKGFIKPFLLIFLVVFMIINWSDISWFFNYHFWSSAFSSIDGGEEKRLLDSSKGEYSDKKNSIEIPELSVSAPIITSRSAELDVLENDLNKGVVHFPGSALPGNGGQTVILGHSAPLNWPKIKYDGVFSDISKLKIGDKINVYYNNKKYSYSVKEHMILEVGEDVPKPLTNSENVLLLVSCWPPGKDYKRIAVKAELN